MANPYQILPRVSLEQWAVFRAVVEEGSFIKAAEQLNRSQSSVSYALAKMEERLPAPALVLKGRKAELTELGQVLYRQACNLLDQALSIDRSADYLARGWEAEVVIAADALTPMSKLFCVLQGFSQQSPTTRIRILETTLSGTDEALLERKVQMALTPHVPTGFLAQPLWQIRMLPVVSAEHPLAYSQHKVTERELMQNRQIVIRDSGLKRERSSGWLAAEQRWTVSHFASSVEAVKAGLGFAFIPEDHIRQELATAELVTIPLAIEAERHLSINLILADQSQAGLATRALANEFLLNRT